MFRRFWSIHRGASAIEYGLIAARAAVAAMKSPGNQLGDSYPGTVAKISETGA